VNDSIYFISGYTRAYYCCCNIQHFSTKLEKNEYDARFIITEAWLTLHANFIFSISSEFNNRGG
jgi:hypothetical protein